MQLEINKLKGLALSPADHSSNSSKQTHPCVIICKIGVVQQIINPLQDQTKLHRIITKIITSVKWKNVKRKKRISERSN